MKLTVIVDNISSDNISGEWGLSILVERGDTSILVDAGASNLFAENLARLGYDISRIDYATLSHAHYDHANGLPRFLEQNKRATLYLRKGTQANCYAKKFIFRKYIGIPRQLLTKYADRIEYVEGDYSLCQGVWLIPHKTEKLEEIGERELMYTREGRKWRPDNFCHEQSLVLETGEGLVIINSCSHGGALNIVNDVKDTFPDRKICAYVGGLHLFNKSEEEVRQTAREIASTGIQKIYTGHCTKDRAFDILRQELGDQVQQFHVGMVLEFSF